MELSRFQNDYGYTLTFTLNLESGMLYDLTGSSVQFRAKQYDATSNVVLVRDCVVATDPATGICSYTVQKGDFAQVGHYAVELVVTNPTAVDLITLSAFELEIIPRLTL